MLTLSEKQMADAITAGIGAMIANTLVPITPEAAHADRDEPLERRIPGSTAAGTSYTFSVPGEIVLEPLSIVCRLSTSVAAGQRSLTLEYQDSRGVAFCVAGANVTVGPGQVQRFCWQPEAGVGTWPVNDTAVATLPRQRLYPTEQLVLRLVGADAADQIDQIMLSVRELATG